MYIPFGLNLKLAATCELSVGAPSASAGNNDEYCVDVSTGDLYRKRAGVWVLLGNIQGNAAGSGAVQKQSATVTHADLTDAVNGEAQVVNLGAALPANAVLLGHQTDLAASFTGGGATAVKLDIGGTDPKGIVDQYDVFGTAPEVASPGYQHHTLHGNHMQGDYGGQQLVATFTPDGGHTLLGLTAGGITATFYYAVVP